MNITKDIEKIIKELYIGGLGIVKISKQIHTSPDKVKKALLNCGIDVTSSENKYALKKPFGYWDNNRGK